MADAPVSAPHIAPADRGFTWVDCHANALWSWRPSCPPGCGAESGPTRELGNPGLVPERPFNARRLRSPASRRSIVAADMPHSLAAVASSRSSSPKARSRATISGRNGAIRLPAGRPSPPTPSAAPPSRPRRRSEAEPVDAPASGGARAPPARPCGRGHDAIPPAHTTRPGPYPSATPTGTASQWPW